MTRSNSTASRSSRHIRVDEDFLALLEEDFGIEQQDLRAAFYGAPAAPKKQAIAICEWATYNAGCPEQAGDAIRAWAKRRGVGVYKRALVDAPPLEWEGMA